MMQVKDDECKTFQRGMVDTNLVNAESSFSHAIKGRK
jgi:hypothetical protein